MKVTLLVALALLGTLVLTGCTDDLLEEQRRVIETDMSPATTTSCAK